MRIAVTGHRDLDEATATSVEIELRVLIGSLVPDAANDLVGISCLAAGADQIFARVVLALGGRLEVILPAYEYASTLAGRDREAFDELRRRADTTRILARRFPGPGSYLTAGLRMLDSADLLIAVWDGHAAQGRGGTAEIAKYAKGRMPVHVIWPAGAARLVPTLSTAP